MSDVGTTTTTTTRTWRCDGCTEVVNDVRGCWNCGCHGGESVLCAKCRKTGTTACPRCGRTICGSRLCWGPVDRSTCTLCYDSASLARSLAPQIVAQHALPNQVNVQPVVVRCAHPEWLVLPGQYSGDMWHVAAAVVLNERLKAAITYATLDDGGGVVRFGKFFTDIGAGAFQELIDTHLTEDTVDLAYSGIQEIQGLSGKLLAWQYTAAVQEALLPRSVAIAVHPVYCSTSAIMRVIERKGLEATRALLSVALTANLDPGITSAIHAYAQHVLGQFGKKILFVLGRLGGYNPQHDLDAERLESIARAAASEGYQVVLIGNLSLLAPKEEKGKEERKEEPVKKKKDQQAILIQKLITHYRLATIDLMDWATLSGDATHDERKRACFWRAVAGIVRTTGQTVKLVGGRSGSTDLPAFMGIDVLCWDVCDFTNIEYLRLLMTGRTLMHVTHTAIEKSDAPVLIVPADEINFERDVGAFLAGTFATSVFRLSFSKRALKKAKNLNQLVVPVLEALNGVLDLLFLPDCTPSSVTLIYEWLRLLKNDETVAIDDVSDCLMYLSHAVGKRHDDARKKYGLGS